MESRLEEVKGTGLGAPSAGPSVLEAPALPSPTHQLVPGKGKPDTHFLFGQIGTSDAWSDKGGGVGREAVLRIREDYLSSAGASHQEQVEIHACVGRREGAETYMIYRRISPGSETKPIIKPRL